jgi:hypothetical protein
VEGKNEEGGWERRGIGGGEGRGGGGEHSEDEDEKERYIRGGE